MSTGLGKSNIGMVALGLALLLLSILASANLDGVTLETPADNGNITGTYLLNATTNGWALNVTFYWSNDTGTTWYAIQTVDNTTAQQSEFTYNWDSTGINDGTYYFNATAMNGTTFVSDANTGITVDNTAPIITVNDPQNNSMVQASVATLNVTLTEDNPDVSWWELNSNGTNFTGCIGCVNFENDTGSLGDGEHNITVWSNDTLGNENSTDVFFRMATTPVTINIKDWESGFDLQGALVNLTSSYETLTNTTDSDGNATILVDATLLYNLTVSKSGYTTNTTLTGQNFTTSMERGLTLTGNSTLQGYVGEIGSGNPLVASVSVYDNSTDILMYQTQSNSSGYYSLTISGDFTYYLNFTSSGYVSQITGNYIGSAELNTSLYQEGYGSFTFIVQDKWNDRPIPNANVTVEWSVNESGLTNSSGMVLMQVPAAGSFDIHVSVSGYSDNSSLTSLSVVEGSNTNVQVDLRGDSKIYGYVRDSANSQGVSAFLEIWDENNTQKLGWSPAYYYNGTSGSGGYYEIYYPSTLAGLSLYVHCSLTGYTSAEVYSGGTQQTDVSLVGTATAQGKVVDKGNTSVGINGATVELFNATSGSTIYQQSTSPSGNFSINVRNGTNYTLRVTKTGYTTYTDVTPYNTSHDYGSIEMEGTALVFGKVVDEQNQSINIQGVNVKFSYGNLTYTTTTNSIGQFELNVSPGCDYDIVYTKMGYNTKTTSFFITGYTNLGTITLTGSNLINGTVTDPTRYYYWGVELDDVQVKLVESGGSRVFITKTNSNGYYSLYVPSDILSYSITFAKDGFKQKSVSQAGDVTLTGATHVEGRVYDLYNNKNLENAEVCFDDMYYGYYCTYTNASGYYSIDLGVENNYFILVEKSGYNNNYFGFTDSLGFPYDSGDTGAWDRTEDIGLQGGGHVYVKTVDSFSGDPVENSQICLKKEGEQDCFYSQITNQDGYANFYAKKYEYYDILINSLGYPSVDLGTNYIGSSGYSNTVELGAYAKIHVYDQYAEEPLRNIPNVNIGLYYYNDETEFNYTLDETVVNVTVTCDFVQRDGINVTLNGTTITTSGGKTNVTFHRVPTGLHNVTLDGNLTGCGISTEQINISDGGQAYSFPDYAAYNLNKTVLLVKVENSAGTGLESCNVTANSSYNYTANEAGSGIYNFTYIIGGLYNVSANHTDYYYNSTNYTVTPGTVNNFTFSPLVLQPHPGNLSIYVQNSSSALDGISVTLDNGTEFTNTTTGGWANFTGLISAYDIKVNGTAYGYEYNLTEDYFVEPNQNTVLTYTLDPTQVVIWVFNQTNHEVNESNVTFWNGSNIATSARGEELSALTNSSGMLVFDRIKEGYYNVTVNKTGYTMFTTSVELSFISSSVSYHVFYLNKTMLEVTVESEKGQALNNTYVTLKNSTYGYDESGYSDEDGKITFDLSDYSGIFNLTVNGSSLGYNWSSTLITTSPGSLNKETVVLKPNSLNVTVRDSDGGLVEDDVIVSIGSLVNTTSSGHAVIYEIIPDSYTLLTDGTLQGYGTNSTPVDIDYNENIFTSIVGITRLTVHVYNSTLDPVENANVSILDLTTGQLEQNGKGQGMNGTTDSAGNVTFSFVPVGDYNITVEKQALSNFTVYILNVSNSGVNNSVSIDPDYGPPEEPPYSGDPDDPPLLFTVFNSTGFPIENVTVTAIDRTDNSTAAEGLTNSTGQVVLNVLNNKLFNFIIDGEAVGYGKITNYSVPIGLVSVSDNDTDQSGQVTLNVDGRTNYYVKTQNNYGYYEHDDNDTGTIRNGTYDDDVANNPYVRPSIQAPLTGQTNLTGTIYDANFVNPVDLDYEPVYSQINLYYDSGCMGDIRYSTNTEANGSYLLYISPKQLGYDVTADYCMKVTGTGWGTGYEFSKQFQAGAEELNKSMQGAGDVSGNVKEVITESPLDDVNISLRSKQCYGGYSNCEAYRAYTTSGVFEFSVSSHTDYYPYDILLNKTNYFTQEYNDTIYPGNTSLVYYLIPLGRSIMNLNVSGSNITQNVTIKWGDDTYSSTHKYCSFGDNVLSCLLPSGGRVLTVNGSDIGYGIYSEYINLVQGENYSLSVGLNETNVNISIVNQDGAHLDNITVTLNGFQNVTENGYVFFNKVPGGTRNVTFSGNLSKIYGMGSQTDEIDVAPGENNTYQYSFNETQFLVTAQNETPANMSGLMVYLENENNSFQNTTDSSGQSLFRQVPYGNYTVSFNSTQIILLGYQNTSETVEVLLGEGPSTGNNKTMVLEDVEVWFNLTNTTSDPLQSINVSLMQGSSIAQSGYGSYLTNLTDSGGLAVLHNVVPSDYSQDEYDYKLDGNSTGYGIYSGFIDVTTSGTNISSVIPPLSVNVTVKDQNSQDLEANVTLYRGSQIAQSAKGTYLSLNSTGGFALFTHLYANNYMVNVTKDNYSSYSQEYNFTYGVNSLNVTLTYQGTGTTTTTTTTTTVSGGGGGSSTTPTVTTEVSEDKVEISGISLKKDKSQSIDIDDWSGMVYKLALWAAEKISKGKIIIERIDPFKLWDTPKLSNDYWKVLHYLKIDTENIEGKVKSVTLYFSVEKDWMEENSLGSVALWKYDGGWVKLETEKVEETQTSINYKSTFTEFSYFAVAGRITEITVPTTIPMKPEDKTVCGNGICEFGEEETCPEDCKEVIPEGLGIIIWLVPILIVISGLGLWFYFNREKKEEKKPKIVRLPPPPKPIVKIKDIVSSPEKYIGKKVMVEGDITTSEFLPEENRVLYTIKDSTGEINGLSIRAGYEGKGTIEGIVRKKKRRLYIEF